MCATKFVVVLLMVFTLVAQADTNEIEYLLEAVADSGCEFWRNGKTHSAKKASQHLRMKYARAKKYVKTADDFIVKLASRSSISKKPYRYTCSVGTSGFTASWLREKLAERRAMSRQQSR
ncbi:MAG: DUF5329 family protein [Gammaproteobacteria bacterium]